MQNPPQGGDRSMRFSGKTLLVTGGGSGIGAAIARRFASEGGKVAIVDRHEENAKAVAATLPSSIAIALDVSDEARVQAAVATTRATFGGIHCLVNAAGYIVTHPIESFPVDDWNALLLTHVGGTMMFCKHVIPVMREQGGGSIVNFSSTSALMASNHNGPYAAAKSAIIGFTRQVSLEAGPIIRVNAIAPGRIKTPFTIPIYTKAAGGNMEEGLRRAGQGNILKRMAEPEEIAAPVCFLLSDEASFITGTTLVADGGQTAI